MYGWQAIRVTVIAASSAVAGCGLHTPVAPLFDADVIGQSPTTAVVAGDFDDMESAMYAATVAAEVVDVATSRPAPDQIRFDLATLGGSPGWMIATLRPDGLIEIRARVGRFGDVDRERHLIAAVAARLEELKGILASPVKDRVPPPPAAPAGPP